MIWLSAWTTCRPSPTSSVICVLPWMTALHLTRPTPLRTHLCIRDGDSLSSGDEAARVITGVTMKRSVRSHMCIDVRSRRTIASRDRRRGCWWECVTGARHPRSAPRRTAGRRCGSYWWLLLLPRFGWSVNNRLSRDDDQLRKKPSFTSLKLTKYLFSPNCGLHDAQLGLLVTGKSFESVVCYAEGVLRMRRHGPVI